MKKEKLVEINIQEGSGKREVTMRKSSLRESRNYDANSHATAETQTADRLGRTAQSHQKVEKAPLRWADRESDKGILVDVFG